MKLLLTLLALVLSNTIFSQIPTGYYDSAMGYTGDSLKIKLHHIIKDHTEFPYTSSGTDVWDILKETDRDPNNSDNVILIYSGISINAAQEYNNADGWTREHVWAKSRGDFGTTTGPGTDVHALRPLDNTTNTTRNNRSFDNCITCLDVIDRWGNTTGSKKDSNIWTFEPRDEVKGDVARMIFYMTIRYEGLDSYPDLELTELVLPQENDDPVHGVLSTLLEWHRIDPVDDWEKNRNNIIYYSYQNNRNPFIDNPFLATLIWSGPNAENKWNFNSTNNKYNHAIEMAYNSYENTISLNHIENENLKTVELLNLNGQIIEMFYSSNFSLPNISKGIYFIKLNLGNEVLIRKIFVSLPF